MNKSLTMKITFDVCPYVIRRLDKKAAFYSHCGNILFPVWECFVPKVGIIFRILAAYFEISGEY